jgi:hypothetical protein
MPRIIESTISGRDAGGFVWENVFHVLTSDDVTDTFPLLTALNSEIETSIMPAFTAAMAAGTFLLDIASKIIDPATTYTLHQSENEEGARVGDAALGAIAGVLKWLPVTGIHTGRMFICCGLIGDFVNDVMDAAYHGLLTTLANAFTALDGSDPSFGWQLTIHSKKAGTDTPVAGNSVLFRPTTLNKRLRT